MFTFCLCQAITWFWSPSAPTPQQRDKKTYKPGENGVTLHFFLYHFDLLKGKLEICSRGKQGEIWFSAAQLPELAAPPTTTSHCQPAARWPHEAKLCSAWLPSFFPFSQQFPMCANEQGIHTHKEKEITSLTSKIWNTHRVEDASNALVSRAAHTTHSKNAGRSLVRSSSVTTVRWRRVQGNRNNHQRLKGKYV